MMITAVLIAGFPALHFGQELPAVEAALTFQATDRFQTSVQLGHATRSRPVMQAVYVLSNHMTDSVRLLHLRQRQMSRVRFH